MAKLIITFLILCPMLIAIGIAEAAAVAKDTESVSNWFETLRFKKEKITKFHYYFHHNITGDNTTALYVARADNITNSSPTLFGIVVVADEPLTVGPEPDSELVGRAQGMFTSAQMTSDIAVLMTMNIVFTSGEYNGSTLSLFGWNREIETYREMPIVGGSGVFRLARGVAIAKTVSYNPATCNGVVEYNVIVLHYIETCGDRILSYFS